MTQIGLDYLKYQESGRHNKAMEKQARNELAWEQDIGNRRYDLDVSRAQQGLAQYANQVVHAINQAAARGDELAYQAGLDTLTQLSSMYGDNAINFRQQYDNKTGLESAAHTQTRIVGHAAGVFQRGSDRVTQQINNGWQPVNAYLGGLHTATGHAAGVLKDAGSMVTTVGTLGLNTLVPGTTTSTPVTYYPELQGMYHGQYVYG